MSLATRGSKLIVDVFYPDRFLFLEWIGEPGRLQHDIRLCYEYYLQIGIKGL